MLAHLLGTENKPSISRKRPFATALQISYVSVLSAGVVRKRFTDDGLEIPSRSLRGNIALLVCITTILVMGLVQFLLVSIGT